MSKVTLNDVVTFQNDQTAANIVNTNSATIETAFDNTLSRDGTSPNQMGANLDMNSNRILNLPAPASSSEPLRFGDVNPTGLVYSAGTNIGIAGTVISTTNNPTFSTSVTTPQIKNSAGIVNIPASGTITIPATTDTLVGRATTDTLTNKTLTSPTIATITNTGTLTLPTGPDNILGRASTDTLTNKTINTAGTGNHIQISGVDITRGQILGETGGGNASAGNIGEFLTSSGGPVSLTSNTGANICSLSLTAGDWDVWGWMQLGPGGSTITGWQNSISTTNSVISNPFNTMNVNIAGAGYNFQTPLIRLNVASTTTIFNVVFVTFSGGTATVSGNIYARRAR
jgi:hypothetical protein